MTMNTETKFCFLILTLSWVKAQEYIENLHDSKYGTRIKDIPKAFDLKGFDANLQFQKYFDEIQEIAVRENLNVVFHIKVQVDKPQKHSKRINIKKGRSKKYNVPLKKTSMKLSNFEVWIRKMAEQQGSNNKGHQQNYDKATTIGQQIRTTTKQIQLKYKPIISRVKTNYTKFVRPVRNRVITLTK